MKLTTQKSDMQTTFETTMDSYQPDIFLVKGKDRRAYSKLLSLVPETEEQKKFFEDIDKALTLEIKDFKVPVADYFISRDSKIHFSQQKCSCLPYSFKEIRQIAKANDMRLGTKYEFRLYEASQIINLMDSGLEFDEALERYRHVFIPNFFYILEKDEEEAFWVAVYQFWSGEKNVFADIYKFNSLNQNFTLKYSKGWYVFN